nr:cytidylate kinase-like family protein [Prevotella sp.]
MNKNEKFIITINREYGSGGHAVATELAKRLHVKLIDKQILSAVAEKFNMTTEEAEQLEHHAPSWWDDFSHFYEGFMSMHEYSVDARDITSRQLFTAQRVAMKDIADKESCVIVGRCAFDLFKDDPNCVKIFIHSPLEMRVKRIMERNHVSEGKARELIQDNDYTRQVYVKTFTGRDWYDARNYDLTLDVGGKTIEETVDLLQKLM